MNTLFPKKENHIPKCFVINAENLILGRLCTKISLLLRGKQTNYFTPYINQSNYVIVLNANKIKLSKDKEIKKIYYSNNQRPGSLKSRTFLELKKTFPIKIIEKGVWGMLPKGVLGRNYYKKLFVFPDKKINVNVLKNKFLFNYFKTN